MSRVTDDMWTALNKALNHAVADDVITDSEAEAIASVFTFVDDGRY